MTAAPAEGSRALRDLIGLRELWAATSGHPAIGVGVIDGPVNTAHHALRGAAVSTVAGATAAGSQCAVADSIACQHGTFVVGLLAATRDEPAPGWCPACPVVVRQIFCEEGTPGFTCPEVTAHDLAGAIVETMDAGVRILNLSVGLSDTGYEENDALRAAYDEARDRGILVVAAAGNHGGVGHVPLFRHPWVIPVAACDAMGRPLASTNLGIGTGRGGLLAPGHNVTGLAATGTTTALTGTSVAAPIVTGTAALVWSMHPDAPAHAVRRAMLRPGVPRRSIVPPLVHGDASWHTLTGESR